MDMDVDLVVDLVPDVVLVARVFMDADAADADPRRSPLTPPALPYSYLTADAVMIFLPLSSLTLPVTVAGAVPLQTFWWCSSETGFFAR
jgi:hypothetical protein